MNAFSVFDGHGGKYVSNYLSQNLHKTIFQMLSEKGQIISSIEESF